MSNNCVIAIFQVKRNCSPWKKKYQSLKSQILPAFQSEKVLKNYWLNQNFDFFNKIWNLKNNVYWTLVWMWHSIYIFQHPPIKSFGTVRKYFCFYIIHPDCPLSSSFSGSTSNPYYLNNSCNIFFKSILICKKYLVCFYIYSCTVIIRSRD